MNGPPHDYTNLPLTWPSSTCFDFDDPLILQEVIDGYMATRMALKLGTGIDDDGQLPDDEDDPSTKQEFDDFKQWLEATTAKKGSSSSATLPPKPVVADHMPPPVEVPKKCKCNSNPCNSIGL